MAVQGGRLGMHRAGDLSWALLSLPPSWRGGAGGLWMLISTRKRRRFGVPDGPVHVPSAAAPVMAPCHAWAVIGCSPPGTHLQGKPFS